LNKGIKVLAFLACLLLTASPLSAQNSGGNSQGFIIGLIVVGAILLLWAIITITDKLMQIEADKAGIDPEKENMSLFPRFKELFSKGAPGYAKDEHFVRLKKGFNIKLAGGVEENEIFEAQATRFSVSPYNYRGISPIPKVVVEAGNEVKAGDVLFFDKKRPTINYVAPVSGEIVEVARGAKRSISDIVILADKEQQYKAIDAPDFNSVSREDLVKFLADCGAWVMLNQRPYDVVPELEDIPRDIFITTFDTAPLAPNNKIILAGQEAAFQTGINVLGKLTPGKVHLGLDGRSKIADQTLQNIQNAEKHYFAGPHPAGNVGVQIHHISPIGMNDKVWTMSLQEVITLGKIFSEGKYDGSRIVALTGAELNQPKYVRTFEGANIGELVQGNLASDHVRFVSGDVLSGQAKSTDQFMNKGDDQITILEEGDKFEAFGWLAPIAPRPSVSNTYPWFLYPNYKHRANTNTHGEERAFVVSGQYEKVLPMDIYPQFLMKSIMTQEIEKMEGLGINELSEEDVALCEFVCTSKAPLQKLLREGLDYARSQQ